MRPVSHRVPGIVVVVLTLALAGDSRAKPYQSFERLFAHKPGTAVMLDVASGHLITHYRLDLAATRRATPGSTIKPFVLQVALAEHIVDPQQALICRRHLQIGGKRIDCTHPEAPRALRAEEALAYSCNSYFAVLGTRVSSRDLIAHLQQLGFTSPTGLASDEATGVIREPRSNAERQLIALGAAGIEVTPLELLHAYHTLALRQRLGNDDQSTKIISAGLGHSTEFGMAHAAWSKSVSVAGKTGSASDRGSPRTHGWFAGYAPADHPQVALVVFIENGRGADAAYIAGRIFEQHFRSAR